MKELIKELILDFQRNDINTGVKRHLEITDLKGKATVCIGVRRSGKTTFLLQTVKKLLNEGISKENIVFIDFFDERLFNLQYTGLSLILDSYYEIYPQKKNKEKVFFFFDEIQMINGWEVFISRILRQENCHVYISGSSSKMLSKEIATQLRGRSLSWELYPFSFKEFLDYRKISYSNCFSSKEKFLFKDLFKEYFETGGFPETIDEKEMIRIKVHQDYFNTIIFRDIVERFDVSHPKAIFDLTHYLIENIASLYSINKLTSYLKSLGYKVSKTVVSNYLKWFEDSFFLFTLYEYDSSLKKANAKPKKIYCIDHSFIKSISSGMRINNGHLLENLIYIQLKNFYKKINFYKTSSGKEVDFLVYDEQRKKSLIQVSYSIQSENTKKRELDSLIEGMHELDLKKSYLITFDEENTIKIDNKEIIIIPAWKYILQN